MSIPRRQLTIYEINTWVWLSDLRLELKDHGRPLARYHRAEWEAREERL